jgi:hypothetical protein
MRARLDVMDAKIAVPRLGRKGHLYEGPVATGHARAHFGDVYNLNQPPFSVLDDIGGSDLMKALSFDGMSDRMMSIAPPCAETCSWILDCPEYLRWRDPGRRLSNHGVLWIKGKAGGGKSTLMSFLHDHHHQNDSGEMIVSFFFNARSSERLVTTTEGMYRSILYQLLHQLPRLKGSLPQIQIPRSKEDWPIERLEHAFRAIVLGLSMDERVTCFVDALDECNTEDVRNAIERFEEVSESATSKNQEFRVCFSSRYYPQITMRHNEELRLDLQPGHMQDISRYIGNKLVVPKRAKLELSLKIYDRCSGVFLWVVLVVKQLREKSDTGSTLSQLLAILESIPAELQELFADVVDKPDMALISIVQWTLLPIQRLSVEELYFAVHVSIGSITAGHYDPEEIDIDGMELYLLHASRGLMERTRGSDHLGFIHESFREYLVDGGLVRMIRTKIWLKDV